MGAATILKGDARHLDGLLADNILFSPPYAEAQEGGGIAKKGYINNKSHSKKPDTIGNRSYMPSQHGKSEGQIGNLPYGEIPAVISSPPYAETGIGDWKTGRAEFQEWVINELATKGYVKWQGKKYTEKEWRAMNHGRIDGRTTKGVHKHPTDGYGKEKGQIGNLSYGDVDTVITSPPYEESLGGSSGVHPLKTSKGTARGRGYSSFGESTCKEYAPSTDNIGNLKSTNYLEAMLPVYRQCHRVLKEKGLMVLVVKNFIRNKKIVRLDLDTIKLCEQAGFTFRERLQRKLTQQGFWRTIYYQKFPNVPKIEYEDVLIFQSARYLK